MSENGLPPHPSVHPIAIDIPAGSAPSLWSRISDYAATHKAVVYTVGAIVVVASAGSVYYISQKPDSGPAAGKRSKKDRRKKEVKDSAAGKEKAVTGGLRPRWA